VSTSRNTTIPDCEGRGGNRGQRPGHHFRQRLHGQVDVFGLDVRLAAGQDFDEFGFGHRAGFRAGTFRTGPGH
jgi:hypothetical protein